jgi:hypothetical protein
LFLSVQLEGRIESANAGATIVPSWHFSDLMLALADVGSSGKADIAQERAEDRF